MSIHTKNTLLCGTTPKLSVGGIVTGSKKRCPKPPLYVLRGTYTRLRKRKLCVDWLSSAYQSWLDCCTPKQGTLCSISSDSITHACVTCCNQSRAIICSGLVIQSKWLLIHAQIIADSNVQNLLGAGKAENMAHVTHIRCNMLKLHNKKTIE